MNLSRSGRTSFWGPFLGLGLVALAIVFSGRQPEARAVPSLKTPQDFSSAFRNVAGSAMASIVSIETTSEAKAGVTGGGFPGREGFPFDEFFKNDPRFKDMFKDGQRGSRPAPRERGQGSGFIIDRSGIIMTNNHVVANADQVKVRLADGREFLATDVKTDPRTDVAIIRIDAGSDLQPLRVGNSDDTQIGDWVVAIGSPFGLDMSVTAGIISAKGRARNIADREDFLQTDAAINPGNSGGPLLNLDGEVIGINTAIASRSGGYEGIGFAIPINLADWVGRQLIATGAVRRAYLGTGIKPVSDDLAKQFKVPVNTGAVVTQIFPKSPADRADLEPGDVIVELNSVPIKDPQTLQSAVERLEIGKSYPVTVIRGGEKKLLTIHAEEMPSDFTRQRLAAGPSGKESAKDPLGLGMKFSTLTPAMATQMGLGDAEGVVVTEVDESGDAAKAGLEVGDVVEKVGNTAVKTAEEFTKAVAGIPAAESVVLRVRNSSGKRLVVVERGSRD